MNIVITESQYKKLLLEESSNKILGTLKGLKTMVSDILKKTQKQTKIDFEFLLTWGATIGGFVGPVSDFIDGKFPEINDMEKSLLLTGIILTYFTSNKEKLNKVLVIIKEKGLVKTFDEILKKTEDLEKTFLGFVDSLGITVKNLSNMLAYSFLIPILPKLYQMSETGFTNEDISELTKRLLSFGIINLSGETVKEILKKIVSRFKNQ
jgi:hypothetical protein